MGPGGTEIQHATPRIPTFAVSVKEGAVHQSDVQKTFSGPFAGTGTGSGLASGAEDSHGFSTPTGNKIHINGSAGSAALTVKGDSKSWSVDLTLASSNGSQAHLSQKAAEKLQETIREATDAVSELYNILETKDINSDNFSEIKNQAKKQWEKVNTAISALDNVAKTPVGKSEIFISFGIKGDENSTSGNIGLTVTF